MMYPMLPATAIGKPFAAAVPIARWLAVAAALYLAVSFPVFWWTGLMLPAAVPLLFTLLGFLAALALRRILPFPPKVPTP